MKKAIHDRSILLDLYGGSVTTLLVNHSKKLDYFNYISRYD